ncbi:CPBP family intramembrane glutamic endopeptidase [Methanobacterium alcaliphilum]|uniref:CPBP family intramembrane glutamic endopeptidase n=1 Tax=Methanobacterium alcaliphilum TaxID=392018 RepID=UPI00200AA5CC|nr:CPBP family intramembrane glutamic endopeptidase [Methanobacterium alcaliphilum]MCK9150512.1 CPBP family intramembrane metalloprotease [Methanobacterium alcaliphilum]
MKKEYIPLSGFIIALVLTAVAPILTGNSNLQVTLLFPLILIFAYWTKMNAAELGLVFGKRKEYLIAIAYPLISALIVITLATISGHIGPINLSFTALIAFLGLFFTTLILTVTTEEGFFRGWLFGVMEKYEFSSKSIILLTALAFTIWHIPLFFIGTGMEGAYNMIPLYLSTVFTGGAIMGTIRYRSGSIITSSLSHTIWNSVNYTLFGFGTSVGILGIMPINIFDPERGYLGLVINALFLIIFWYYTFHFPKKSNS